MQYDKKEFRTIFIKRLYSFTIKLIKFIEAIPKDNISIRLTDQLLRSSTSILANYIEGQSASSKKDFINYLNIALKSSNESKVWLCLLKDLNRGNIEEINGFIRELNEFSNILASSLMTLRGKRSSKV
ncbi:MAG: four helix bundle protein [Bacteroidetes bacterium]|nr:four helix bundle protein [Bacteroidota bacterium]